MRAGALPTTCAAGPDELSLLLAFAWIVGGPVCSDVPKPAVSGRAEPPEPFLLPTEPGCGMCPRDAVGRPLSRAAEKPTAEDIRIDLGVRNQPTASSIEA